MGTLYEFYTQVQMFLLRNTVYSTIFDGKALGGLAGYSDHRMIEVISWWYHVKMAVKRSMYL
jgi:hypothetical protein